MAEIQLTDEFNSQGGVGGTCYLCNASKRTGTKPDRIITTNLEVDYDAEPGVWPVKWLEFCETCVVEMAHLLGMLTEDEMSQNYGYTATIMAENEDLKAQLQANIKIVDAFITVMDRLPQPVEPSPEPAQRVTGRQR